MREAGSKAATAARCSGGGICGLRMAAAAPVVVPLDLGAGAADLGLPERRGGGGEDGGGDGEGRWPRSPEWRSPSSRGTARR